MDEADDYCKTHGINAYAFLSDNSWEHTAYLFRQHPLAGIGSGDAVTQPPPYAYKSDEYAGGTSSKQLLLTKASGQCGNNGSMSSSPSNSASNSSLLSSGVAAAAHCWIKLRTVLDKSAMVTSGHMSKQTERKLHLGDFLLNTNSLIASMMSTSAAAGGVGPLSPLSLSLAHTSTSTTTTTPASANQSLFGQSNYNKFVSFKITISQKY